MFQLKQMGFTMTKCNSCGVNIMDKTEYCPLCQNVMEAAVAAGAENTAFPNVSRRIRKMVLAFKIVLFQALVVSGSCLFINYYTGVDIHWSWIVASAEAYSVLMCYVMQKEDAGYRMRTVAGLLGALAMIMVIDMVFGFAGWSINYVAPIVMILVHLTLVILMIVNHRNWQSYLILQMGMVFISLILILLMKNGVITSPVLSFVAIGIGLIILLAVLVFGGPRAVNELKRRFYI